MVVHLAKTPQSSGDTGLVETVAQLDSVSVSEHALNVLKLLPGGFFIFGIFIVAPKDIFNEPAKLKSLILNLQQ